MGKYPEIFDYFSVADRVNGDHFHHGAIFLEGDGDKKLVSHFFHFLVNQCFRLRLYMHTTKGLEEKDNTSLTFFLSYFAKNTQIEGKLLHRFAKTLVGANNSRIN